MRGARIKEDGPAYYHILSRVVDRRRVFDGAERERFRVLMRAMEAFSGCEVLTYAILGNHWHILLHVTQRQELSDCQLIERLAHLYDKRQVKATAGSLKDLRDNGAGAAAEQLRTRYSRRMYDVSEFCKTLKQRFTQSYNRRHKRKGTLWEERFKSVLIAGSEGALTTVGAYIDLNPVRVGMVVDPKDYRYCGYGEAMGGCAQARCGINDLMLTLGQTDHWPEVAAKYRQLLYVAGEASGVSPEGAALKPGFNAQQVKAVMDAGGKLPLNVLLRCRVRYFTDGTILGSRAFVDDAFQRHRDRFGAKRVTGARRMIGGDWGDLCAARRLRLDVILAPSAGLRPGRRRGCRLS